MKLKDILASFPDKAKPGKDGYDHLRVFSDWLEDQGNEDEAEAIRWLCDNERWPDPCIYWWCWTGEIEVSRNESCLIPRELLKERGGRYCDLAESNKVCPLRTIEWVIEQYIKCKGLVAVLGE